MRKRTITVNDTMQKGYRYVLTAPAGRGFDPEFKPELTPAQMLRLGVFCGKYMTDCRREFPKSWFTRAKLSPDGRDCALNFFGIDASQPLSEWRRKGWVHKDDPRGWFQWYCRYYTGRRMPDEDRRQTNRSKRIASPGTCSAAGGSDRRCYIGPMTAANFEYYIRRRRSPPMEPRGALDASQK